VGTAASSCPAGLSSPVFRIATAVSEGSQGFDP
jgi:hypothetical protein